MNKSFTLGVVAVAVIALVYVVKQTESAEVGEHKSESAFIPSSESNSSISIVQAPEKSSATFSSQSQSSPASEIPTAAMAAEQTQNAVDFNAPGAGTAQQKAGAAAAANKAYQESKQNH